MAYRRHKYNAKKTEIDGIKFDSKKEARRYAELKLLEKAGLITDLKLQPKYLLQDKFRDIDGKAVRAIHYIADFEYVDEQGQLVCEDTKGFKTADYRLKRKMFQDKYRNYRHVES